MAVDYLSAINSSGSGLNITEKVDPVELKKHLKKVKYKIFI